MRVHSVLVHFLLVAVGIMEIQIQYAHLLLLAHELKTNNKIVHISIARKRKTCRTSKTDNNFCIAIN